MCLSSVFGRVVVLFGITSCERQPVLGLLISVCCISRFVLCLMLLRGLPRNRPCLLGEFFSGVLEPGVRAISARVCTGERIPRLVASGFSPESSSPYAGAFQVPVQYLLSAQPPLHTLDSSPCPLLTPPPKGCGYWTRIAQLLSLGEKALSPRRDERAKSPLVRA